jgi:hypothetical protein
MTTTTAIMNTGRFSYRMIRKLEQIKTSKLCTKLNYEKCITNILTDLLKLNPKTDSFEEKNDKYGGYSISDIINYLYNYKHYLFVISDYQYKNSTILFCLSGIDLRLNITTDDIKILKTFHIGDLCCAKCGELYPNMKRCSGCTFVKYCDNECQHNDWDHHKKICKHLQKIRSFKNEYSDTPIGVIFINQENKKITKTITKTTEEFKKKMKDIKDKRKSKNIIPRMVICPIKYSMR